MLRAMQTRTFPYFAAIITLFVTVSTLFAQTANQPQPQPTPMPPAIPAPVDKPYIGPIQLHVDISDTPLRVWHVRERVPVAGNAKELILLYPQWVPGGHSPRGPISALAGIVTSVDGRRV